jgi:hypothetical protein
VKNRRTTIYIGDEDDKAIIAIKEKYGLSSDSDAIRLALRIVAGGEKRQVSFDLRRQRKVEKNSEQFS